MSHSSHRKMCIAAHRRSQGVQWVQVHPPQGETIFVSAPPPPPPESKSVTPWKARTNILGGILYCIVSKITTKKVVRISRENRVHSRQKSWLGLSAAPPTPPCSAVLGARRPCFLVRLDVTPSKCMPPPLYHVSTRNSSADEIANMNFLRPHCTRTTEYKKRQKQTVKQSLNMPKSGPF